jgi:hypothetical protein
MFFLRHETGFLLRLKLNKRRAKVGRQWEEGLSR